MLEPDCEGKFVRENYAQELLIRITKSESNSAEIVTIYGQSGSGKSSLSNSLYNKVTQHYSKSTVIEVEEIL